MPFSQRLGIACLPNKVGLGLGDGQSCCHSILILRRTLQSATDTGPHPTEGFEEGYELARIERRGGLVALDGSTAKRLVALAE